MQKAKIFILFLGVILLFSFTNASVFISDELIDLGGGRINDLSVISLVGEPLIFIDIVKEAPIAIFNSNESFVFSTAASMSVINFPNTTISFLGDVNNFDNIDAQSRFKETNLNNGSSASAAFTAVNDLGHTTAFGIGSSGFLFDGVPFFNEAAIFHNSPGKFNTANAFDFGWDWRANKLNGTGGFDFAESMQLSSRGSLNISGNFTGDQHYGEMFAFHLVSPETINIPSISIINSSGIFNVFNVSGFQEGFVNGIHFHNDTLIVDIPGLYNVKFSVNYQDLANSKHGFGVAVNGRVQNNIIASGAITAATDIRVVGNSGFLKLEIGDTINVMVGDNSNPATDIQVIQASLNMVRIGS